MKSRSRFISCKPGEQISDYRFYSMFLFLRVLLAFRAANDVSGQQVTRLESRQNMVNIAAILEEHWGKGASLHLSLDVLFSLCQMLGLPQTYLFGSHNI